MSAWEDFKSFCHGYCTVGGGVGVGVLTMFLVKKNKIWL